MERLQAAAASAGITVIVEGGDVQLILPQRDPEAPRVISKGTMRREGEGTRFRLHPAASGAGYRIFGLVAAGFAAIIGFAVARGEGAHLVVALLAAAALGGVFGGLVWLIVHMTASESNDRARRFVRETFADVSSSSGPGDRHIA